MKYLKQYETSLIRVDYQNSNTKKKCRNNKIITCSVIDLSSSIFSCLHVNIKCLSPDMRQTNIEISTSSENWKEVFFLIYCSLDLSQFLVGDVSGNIKEECNIFQITRLV
jgi:hypothetical protein